MRLSRHLVLLLPVLAVTAACGGRAAAPPVARPERPGVHHTLEEGQTLYALSQVYRISISTLITANGIKDPSDIPAGTPIFVPGATRVLSIPARGSAMLMWPLAGRVTSGYGSRGGRHSGIDIDGDKGQWIRAADGGQVASAGKDGKYGLTVVVDHGGGLTTLYAHTSKLLVKKGDRVKRGETIAKVGRSGNARGTHLHFEVRRNGRTVNPAPMLPQQGSSVASRD